MILKAARKARNAGFGVLIFALVVGFTLARCEYANAAGVDHRLDTLGPEFSFCLELNGTMVGSFLYAYNIGSENELVEHRIPGKQGNNVVSKIPGKLKIRDITLKKSISSTLDKEKWQQLVGKEMTPRAKKNGVIIMFDKTSHEVACWNLKNTWPKKFVGKPTTDSSKTMVFESITLESEGVERVK